MKRPRSDRGAIKDPAPSLRNVASMGNSIRFVLGTLGVCGASVLACSSSSGGGTATGDDSGAAQDSGGGQDVTTPMDTGTMADSSSNDSGTGVTDTGTVVQDSSTHETSVPCLADAGMAMCSAACVNVQTDTKNCGGCGHDCLGGACTAGVCQPIVLANLPTGGTPGRIATDGTSVGFTMTGLGSAAGGVYTLNNSGAFQVPTAVDTTSGTTYGAPIAMTSGQVFYFTISGGTTFMTGGTAGMGASGIELGPLNGITGFGVAANGTKVAFGGVNLTNTTVYVLECTLGTPIKCFLEGSEVNANGLQDVATDGTNAYYTSGTDVRWVPLAGGTPALFVGNGTSNNQMALAAGYIYWADVGASTFERSTIPTASESLVLDNTAAGTTCTGLAADARYIYYTQGLTRVYYMKVDGTGTIAALPPGTLPTSIAVDSKALYFIDKGAGTVNKVALPL